MNLRRLLKWLLFLLTIVILFFGGYFLWLYIPLVKGYEVRGAPYSGMRSSGKFEEVYKNKPDVSGKAVFDNGSPVASFLMVNGFWYLRDPSLPLATPGQAGRILDEQATPRTLEEIADAARNLGYKARIRRAYFGVWSLGAYARSEGPNGEPTPVIVEQSLTTQQPGKGQIFRVVVGASANVQEVYVHDYVYGAHHTLSRQDFVGFWKAPPRILIIEPKDRHTADQAQAPFDTPKAKPLSAATARLRTTWYIAEEDRRQGRVDNAITLLESNVKDPEFKKAIWRRFQVIQLTGLMSLYVEKSRYKDVINLEDMVLAINKNLTAVSPGSDEIPLAWVLLGEAYLKDGDKGKARSYAERALKITPQDSRAQVLLDQTM